MGKRVILHRLIYIRKQENDVDGEFVAYPSLLFEDTMVPRDAQTSDFYRFHTLMLLLVIFLGSAALAVRTRLFAY